MSLNSEWRSFAIVSLIRHHLSAVVHFPDRVQKTLRSAEKIVCRASWRDIFDLPILRFFRKTDFFNSLRSTGPNSRS